MNQQADRQSLKTTDAAFVSDFRSGLRSELVNFVYAGSSGRRFDGNQVAGRAQDACFGGSFGKAGRGSLASAPTLDSATRESSQPQRAAAGKVNGTGRITNGLVAINQHVIEGHDCFKVRFADGTETTAFVSATDPDSDVALLQVGLDLPMGLPIASGEAAIGADVFTLSASPHRFAWSVARAPT